MAKLTDYLVYIPIVIVRAIIRMLSNKSADRLGLVLGKISYALLVSRRDIALDNLTRALGHKKSKEELVKICRSTFEGIARTAVEVARFGKTSPQRLAEIIKGDGAESFHKALEAGNGAILITAHFGNYEMTAGWSTSQGFPMDMLVLKQHNLLFDKDLDQVRKSMGVGTIAIGRGMRSVFKALKDNRVIGIAADQHDSTNSMIIDFFGRPAAAAKGPALFSIRTGAPIIPVLLRRVSYNHHELIAHPPIYPIKGVDEDQQVRDMVTKYHQFFEKVISEYPDQWLWTHRRWKAEEHLKKRNKDAT